MTITMIDASIRFGLKKLVLAKPSALASRVNGPNCGSSRNDHMTAPTTAGTANGMKNTVRKNVPYFATPRSKTQAKKNAIASITGIWIAPKMTTRMTPVQNWPILQGLGVVGRAGEARAADDPVGVEAGVDGVAERHEHEEQEAEQERRDEPHAAPVPPVYPG